MVTVHSRLTVRQKVLPTFNHKKQRARASARAATEGYLFGDKQSLELKKISAQAFSADEQWNYEIQNRV